MSNFERFDYTNDEFPSKKYPIQTWYGKKEVPNVLLTLYSGFSGCEDCKKNEIYLDILTQYYEEYDTITGWKIVMEMPVMSPKVYELLTQKKYVHYSTKADDFWRSQATGKDEGFTEPERYFDQMRIEYKLTAVGDPARWYITLWQNREKIPPKEPATIKEVKL